MRLQAANLTVPTSLAIGLLILCGGPSWGQADPKPELVASTDPLPPEQERAAFRLPPGFEAQLVVSEPDIQKPMNLAFDARGRLWVTHSREYPYPVEEGETPRDGVTILDDFGPDGRAGRSPGSPTA